ncbi:hypothetical protein [Halpernia frigidisoli]|uniref:Lipopolysaccharide assembly protein A domain-containing protein n=1 Tax=Halpernia frigidisoli TaxID=1125876 RepID=A0A1I3I0U3_9FLAO|nr:hypothetical protein [Halpernia frigidisoli]SFI41574.1 hypothetical protein SAMN05443292_2502 [Halpernia frigidisoli]
MKNLTFIGIILLALAFLLYYLMPEFSFIKLFEPINLMGILAGIGIGLIIGGLVGYVSKGSSIRKSNQRKDYIQLEKEKKALEVQAAMLANNQSVTNEDLQQKNMQNQP